MAGSYRTPGFIATRGPGRALVHCRNLIYERNMSMTRGQFVVSIESLSYGGSGVGRRDDGKVVFVPLVVPGERVLVSVHREHRGYVEARLQELIKISPWRQEPACPYFPECGGCDWQHIVYAHQVLAKLAIAQEQIGRKGITPSHMEESVLSPMHAGYRCHAQLRCPPSDRYRFGFFRKQSNSVVPVEKCMVLNDGCMEVLERIGDFLGADPLIGLDALEIHAPSDEALLRVFLKGGAGKETLDRLHRMYRTMGLKGLSCLFQGGRGSELVLGDSSCLYHMSIHGREMTFAGSFDGFIQANIQVNGLLIEDVLDKASGAETLLDLYSGSGNFGIPQAVSGRQVIAVENNAALVETGKMLARRNSVPGIRFVRDDACRAVKRFIREKRTFDTVLLDPPREGARGVAGLLCSMKPERIIYVSCNPSTLARDLAELVQGDYSVKSLKLFDMFPQTYHIESVTVLER